MKENAGEFKNLDLNESKNPIRALEGFKSAVDAGLGGLQADERLKQKILHEARNPERAVKKTGARRAAALISVACAAVLLVAVLAFANWNGDPRMSVKPAGDPTQAPGVLATDGVDVALIEHNDPQAPEADGIWASGGSPFPMIGIEGRFYRMLEIPAGGVALGDSAGQVTEYALEPALCTTDHIVSNIVGAGTEVYSVQGMGGALVAAETEGTLRLYQRVSFNGGSVLGGEEFRHVVADPARVTGMALDGAGEITDRETARRLAETLNEYAALESNGTLNSEQRLRIYLDNGACIQMAVRNERLASCGVWSCPEFFEAFAAAAGL